MGVGSKPHLWGLERIICREVDGQEKNTSLVRPVILEGQDRKKSMPAGNVKYKNKLELCMQHYLQGP